MQENINEETCKEGHNSAFVDGSFYDQILKWIGDEEA